MSLTEDQIKKGIDYYSSHKDHVKKLLKWSEGRSYPPTLSEDKNNPNLWKPGHWAWFMELIKGK